MIPRIRPRSLILPCFCLLWLLVPSAGAEPQMGLNDSLSLDLVDAEVREVLTTAARILGAEAAIAPAVTGTVTLDLTSVSIQEMLDTVCERAGCRWTLEAGETKADGSAVEGATTVLRVSPKHGEKTQPISLELVDADLRLVLSTFAQVAGAASVHIAPELTGTVSIKLTAVPWEGALDALCARAGCGWSLEPGPPARLVVTFEKESSGGDLGRIDLSSEAALAPPPVPVLLGVRLRVPGSATAEQVLRFTWDRPVVALRAGEGDGWEARLAWIPLGVKTRVILPIVLRCGAGESSRHFSFDPLTLPIAGGWTALADTAALDLFDATGRSREAVATEPSATCHAERPVEVTYSSQPGSRGKSVLRSPGNYLQIATPPTVDQPTSHAELAVVLLGREGEGASLALLTEDGHGGVAVEDGWAGPGAPWVARVDTDHPVELQVRLLD